MSVLTHIKPCDTDKPYVFISYSSCDSELVWQDVLEFQRRGYNVWLDEINLDKTKASWKDDALTAIQDYCCTLVVFYISASSLTSEACYNELCHTTAEDTVSYHNGEVKYIAIETERINDIVKYKDQVYHRVMSEDIPKSVKQARAKTLHLFIRDFFDTNNEKVRIHPKDQPNRKMDYYNEVTASFPESARIHRNNSDEDVSTAEKEISDNINSDTCDDDAVYLAGLDTTLSEKAIDEQFQYAESLYAEKRYAEAIPCYLPAAAKGNCVAEFKLGSCYESINGNDPEHPHARYWYTKAACHGFTPAMVLLLYRNEKPIPQTMDSTISMHSMQAASAPCKIQDQPESTGNTNFPEQTCTSDITANADQIPSASGDETHSPADTNQIKDTQNTDSISAFPIDVIEKAVKKFWAVPLKIKDLNTDQKMNLHSSFHIYPELGDETFCSILCVTFLNTCKEGFVLSDRYLYINNTSNKHLRINLLTIRSIQPTDTSDTYRIYHKDGTTQKLIMSSVYRTETVSLLNYLINQRYYLVTSAEKQPIQDIPMSIIKDAAEEYFPIYAKKVNDLTKTQTDELTRSFNIDLNSEEAFHMIVCTTLLNTCKEGFLLSNRYLYINFESYKQIAVDLRLVRRIETGKDAHTYLIHSVDGTVIHLWLVSTYRPYVINLLNYIIEKRDALLNT